MRIGARHEQAKALSFLQRECSSAGTSMAAGTRSSFSGRVDIQPVIKVFSFLVPKADVPMRVAFEDGEIVQANAAQCGDATAPAAIDVPSLPPVPDEPRVQRPLVALAYARSGDKGDDENIGVIARRPEYLPLLREQLTPRAVRAYFAHLVHGEVERFDVPGLHALNFLMHGALAAAAWRACARTRSARATRRCCWISRFPYRRAGRKTRPHNRRPDADIRQGGDMTQLKPNGASAGCWASACSRDWSLARCRPARRATTGPAVPCAWSCHIRPAAFPTRSRGW